MTIITDGSEQQEPVENTSKTTEVASSIRTGLVLSGGGLKFAVHLALYKQLESFKYRINSDATKQQTAPLIELFDCIVGTSAGAVTGSVIACGFCSEDAELITELFSRKELKSYITDYNFRGLSNFLLSGDTRYVKGLIKGEGVGKLLEVIFSHNFLRGLGKLYEDYTELLKNYVNKPLPDCFKNDVLKLFQNLYKLPRLHLPDTVASPDSQSSGNSSPVEKLDLITFQDINPPSSDQDIKPTSSDDLLVNHTANYRKALDQYYDGRHKALRYVSPSWQNGKALGRPILLIVGTDLVTGQKTIFSNCNRFNSQDLYERKPAISPPISYWVSATKEELDKYENKLTPLFKDRELTLAQAAPLDQELRPTNYVYNRLSKGLPVAWAIRASLSIPGIFVPAEIHYLEGNTNPKLERVDYFIDGGVSDNYAVQVASHENLGNCKHILGGNIGNLGRRTHNFKINNVADILLRTMLLMGDGIVDTNAANRIVLNSSVFTVDELTPTEESSVSKPEVLQNLLKEGEILAKRFFQSLAEKDDKTLINPANLFGENLTSYRVYLPDIEKLPGNQESPGSDTLGGAAELKRLLLKENYQATPDEKQALAQDEANLNPPAKPPSPLEGGKITPVNWLVVLTPIVLVMLPLLALGIWRLTLFIWQSLPGTPIILPPFDSWGFFWEIILVLLTCTILTYIFSYIALLPLFFEKLDNEFSRGTKLDWLILVIAALIYLITCWSAGAISIAPLAAVIVGFSCSAVLVVVAEVSNLTGLTKIIFTSISRKLGL